MKILIRITFLLVAFSLSAQTADEYFETAKKEASKRKYYKAIPNFKKAIELDSTKLDYYWYLSKSLLKENIRGSNRTEPGVFEGITILEKLLVKGKKEVEVYEALITANEFVLDDYSLRYKKTTNNNYKEIALNAYKSIKNTSSELLKVDPTNDFAKSKLKYLKEPKF